MSLRTFKGRRRSQGRARDLLWDRHGGRAPCPQTHTLSRSCPAIRGGYSSPPAMPEEVAMSSSSVRSLAIGMCALLASVAWTATGPVRAHECVRSDEAAGAKASTLHLSTPKKQVQIRIAANQSAPTIASLSPTSGPVGTLVTATGTGFTSENTVRFANAKHSFAAGSPVGSSDGQRLQFRVTTCPSYAPMCPGFVIVPGTYNVTVVNSAGSSNQATFTVTRR